MEVLLARLGGLNLVKPWANGSMLVQNSVKGFLSPVQTIVITNRGAKTQDSGIIYVRPVEPPCISTAKSGDLEPLPEVPADLVVPDLRKSEVLKKAPPEVQSMYTFKWSERTVRKLMVEETFLNRVKRHMYDDDSPEVKVAKMTCSIRRMQLHMENNRHDARSKIVLKELIDKRKKRLKKMRRCNYPLFEYLLEKLNLVYYPPLVDNKLPQRSYAMLDLATQFTEDLKTARLANYREELEAQKPDFLRRKAQTMRAIVDDEKKLKIAPSFTEEEIQEVENLQKIKVLEREAIPKQIEDIF